MKSLKIVVIEHPDKLLSLLRVLVLNKQNPVNQIKEVFLSSERPNLKARQVSLIPPSIKTPVKTALQAKNQAQKRSLPLLRNHNQLNLLLHKEKNQIIWQIQYKNTRVSLNIQINVHLVMLIEDRNRTTMKHKLNQLS